MSLWDIESDDRQEKYFCEGISAHIHRYNDNNSDTMNT